MKEEYKIVLREDAKPYALSTPRRIAIPLLPKVKKELERMEEMGVVSLVREPTDWCSGMVVVLKDDGSVRICVYLTRLNESVRREHHPLPAVEEALAQVADAIDANSGFWQIPLAKESTRSTTFITPFGRFCFNRLSFGITSAPNIFNGGRQRFYKTWKQPSASLMMSLSMGIERGAQSTASHSSTPTPRGRCDPEPEKCVFSGDQVKFLGQVVDHNVVRPDPNKISAITNFNG